MNTHQDGFIQMFLKKRHQQIVRGELEQLRERLWRFCLMRTGVNHADADDLFQATALRALEKADQFTPGTRFDNWAFTIAVSIWNNELRSRKVRLGKGIVDAAEDELADETGNVETNIFAGQVLNRITHLPQGQSMAVLLVYVEGYSYKDAAEILAVPIGTVMSRLATARKTLKDWAEQEAEQEKRGEI